MVKNSGARFLNEAFNLNRSREVDAAAKRAEVISKEKVPDNVDERVQNYLDRLQFILNNEDTHKRERARSLISRMLYDRHIVTPEQIVDYHLRAEQRIAKQRGNKITPKTSEQAYDELKGVIEETIDQQTMSLDVWIEYLLSKDAMYPDWLKYYTFRNILNLTNYDHQKGKFSRRSTSGIDWTTLREFPELNREALAYVLEEIRNKYQEVARKEDIRKLLQGENFAKLYASAYQQATPTNTERQAITEGRWVKFDQGSDPQLLVDSIRGQGTRWCTAEESTARSQLLGGDFYVYYSLDEQNQPTIPRAAIRMDGDDIAEVRGIADNQNLDRYIGDIVQKKLQEFPDHKSYYKKSYDMSRLTVIEKHINQGKDLSKDDLIFLYEINETIQDFGYGKDPFFGFEGDPRIKELRNLRNPREDAPIVLDCNQSEIAWGHHEVSNHTKAYIGPLFPGIFEKFSGVEHIFTSFPEQRITRDKIVIGIKDRNEFLKAMELQEINISSCAREMIDSPDFLSNQSQSSGIRKLFKGEIPQASETIDIVRLKIRDLGFTNPPTTTELFAKIEEFGLELCPAEVGPLYRLQYTNQQLGDWLYIGMIPIFVSGEPNVFGLGHDISGLCFDDGWARSDVDWDIHTEFMFQVCKNS